MPSRPCLPASIHTDRSTMPAFSHSAWNGLTCRSKKERTEARNASGSASYSVVFMRATLAAVHSRSPGRFALPVLADRLDRHWRDSPEAAENREAMLALLADLETHLDAARAGGGEKYVERHKKRGKLLPRDRIELLVDRDSAFLELSPFAAYGSSCPIGASIVPGVGVVE